MKWCARCREDKPVGAFGRNRSRPSGLSDYCRECMRVVLREYRQRNLEKVRGENRVRARERYAADPERGRRLKNAWRARNVDKARELHRRCYRRHRQKNLDYARQYREKNAETIRAKRQMRREAARTYGRRWYARNREQAIAKVRRRQARLAQAGAYTAEQWQAIVAYYCPDSRCLACKEQRPLTVDHVVPLDKGGSNYPGNLQCLCLSCNSAKGADSTDYRPDAGAFARSFEERTEAVCP